MHTWKVLTLAVVTAAVAWAGCQTSAPHGRTLGRTAPPLTPAAASAAGLSTEQTNAAVQVYTAKCLRCHKAYDPAQYSPEEWDAWMRKMSKKAHLTPEQSDLVSRYLEAYRVAAGATAPAPR